MLLIGEFLTDEEPSDINFLLLNAKMAVTAFSGGLLFFSLFSPFQAAVMPKPLGKHTWNTSYCWCSVARTSERCLRGDVFASSKLRSTLAGFAVSRELLQSAFTFCTASPRKRRGKNFRGNVDATTAFLIHAATIQPCNKLFLCWLRGIGVWFLSIAPLGHSIFVVFCFFIFYYLFVPFVSLVFGFANRFSVRSKGYGTSGIKFIFLFLPESGACGNEDDSFTYGFS